MFHQYQVIKLRRDLNPVLKQNMEGVILEVYNDETFEVEFLDKHGFNYEYNGQCTFTVSKNDIMQASKLLTKEQKKLADFMSDLSEKNYSAAWLENLEYVLWDAVIKGQRKFGQGLISQKDVQQLRELSNSCNSWIYYDEETEETAIDLSSWNKKFESATHDNPSIVRG